MRTLVAVRDNPGLTELYARLRAAGKAAKVALTACMRQLWTMLKALVPHQKAWPPREGPNAERKRSRGLGEKYLPGHTDVA
jgi:transposase